MDPASVVGLVSATASLVSKGASVVQALHRLAEEYQVAEISILAVIEECNTIRFAWNRIQSWASLNLHQLEGYEELHERLQRSIYAGQLILSALEADITRPSPKGPQFRRRARIVWYEKVLRDHQNRLRGQVGALHLLLEVMQMPHVQDRLEILSVKESVFQEADESAHAIVPSRWSSADSDSASTRSTQSTKLQYIPFAFENMLFTSHVYKRNYRFSKLMRLIGNDKPNRSQEILPKPTLDRSVSSPTDTSASASRPGSGKDLSTSEEDRYENIEQIEMIGSADTSKCNDMSLAKLKLQRLNVLIERMEADLHRRRIPISEAALDIVAFADKMGPDWMVPSRWGTMGKHEPLQAPWVD